MALKARFEPLAKIRTVSMEIVCIIKANCCHLNLYMVFVYPKHNATLR